MTSEEKRQHLTAQKITELEDKLVDIIKPICKGYDSVVINAAFTSILVRWAFEKVEKDEAGCCGLR